MSIAPQVAAGPEPLHTRRTSRHRNDQGFSLVELVITISLLGGVAAMGTSLFLAGLKGDAQVHTTTQATMQAQSIAQGIEKSVRNAQRIGISGSTLTVWTTLGGDRNCQRWSLAGSGAGATIQFAQGRTTPGAGTNWVGNGAVSGAELALTDVSAGHYAGVTYAVTLPSKTKPVKVSGTVRSRSAEDTATTPSTATCDL